MPCSIPGISNARAIFRVGNITLIHTVFCIKVICSHKLAQAHLLCPRFLSAYLTLSFLSLILFIRRSNYDDKNGETQFQPALSVMHLHVGAFRETTTNLVGFINGTNLCFTNVFGFWWINKVQRSAFLSHWKMRRFGGLAVCNSAPSILTEMKNWSNRFDGKETQRE